MEWVGKRVWEHGGGSIAKRSGEVVWTRRVCENVDASWYDFGGAGERDEQRSAEGWTLNGRDVLGARRETGDGSAKCRERGEALRAERASDVLPFNV